MTSMTNDSHKEADEEENDEIGEVDKTSFQDCLAALSNVITFAGKQAFMSAQNVMNLNMINNKIMHHRDVH